MHEVKSIPQKTLLVSATTKGSNREKALENLDELAFLVETTDAEVVYKIYQELPKLNRTTCIGSGKIEEIKELIIEKKIELVVFDDDLTPMQNRNLVRELNIKVIDRSGIILDIFASRAKTIEAKTQVELAQMQYLLPRLTRLWTHLSKQFGGVGTTSRGPGETQIETDRRLVRERIQFLKQKLEEIDIQKIQQRKGRGAFTRFALVGYTNAGKSTLMKSLTNADVYIEDKLFATLDTTVRSFELPGGETALLSDTVGFIRKLPTHLVASFRSTLAEAQEADVLIHVVDVSHPQFRDQIKAVNSTLDSLNITNKPIVLVLNKIDKLEDINIASNIAREFENSVLIDAKRSVNILSLLNLLKEKNDENSSKLQLFVPYSHSHILGKIYEKSEILNRTDEDEGTRLFLKVQSDTIGYFTNSFGSFFV